MPMVLDMNGEYVLPVRRAADWSALNDPKMLQPCIPGCESLEKVSETEFAVVARLAVGPVKARVKGKLRLQDLDPPMAYTLVGESEGSIAGFAKGNAAVVLADADGGAKLPIVLVPRRRLAANSRNSGSGSLPARRKRSRISFSSISPRHLPPKPE